MHQRWCTRDDAPCQQKGSWYTPTRVECFPDLLWIFFTQIVVRHRGEWWNEMFQILKTTLLAGTYLTLLLHHLTNWNKIFSILNQASPNSGTLVASGIPSAGSAQAGGLSLAPAVPTTTAAPRLKGQLAAWQIREIHDRFPGQVKISQTGLDIALKFRAGPAELVEEK